MNELQLYSSALCPFSHQVRLTLAEKALEALRIEINLPDKSAELTLVSPTGQLPVLRHGQRVVTESFVIAEYLDEAFPGSGNDLLPLDAWSRAQVRLWMRFAHTRLYAHTHELIHSWNQATYPRLHALLIEDLQAMNAHLAVNRHRGGPYWMGSECSHADLAFYPWFEQFSVLERFRGFVWPTDCWALAEWQLVMASRPSVLREALSERDYLSRYALKLSNLVPTGT